MRCRTGSAEIDGWDIGGPSSTGLLRRSPSPEAGPGQVAWNRVETRTLVESHVGINDLSDYACMLKVHMTYYTNNVPSSRSGTQASRFVSGGPCALPGPRQTHPSDSAAPHHAWCWSRAHGRQRAAERCEMRALRDRKSARTGQVRGAGCAAVCLLGLIGLAKNETTPRDRSRGCGNGRLGGNSKTCEIV